MTPPEVYQSPDGSGLAVETSDGEFIELGRNILGSWDKQGMIEVVPDSWVRLVPLPDSETEWGWRPDPDCPEAVIWATGETTARERTAAARGRALMQRRAPGPWIEVIS
jgi:hypothetical protein